MPLTEQDEMSFAIGIAPSDRTCFHAAPFAARLGDQGSLRIPIRRLPREEVLAGLGPAAARSCHLRNLGSVFSLSRFSEPRDAPLVVGRVADPAAFSAPCSGAMDLLICPAGADAALLPTELAQFEQPISLALSTFHSLLPDARAYNAYVQVLSGVVPPGMTQRPRAIHADGFQGARQLDASGRHHLPLGYNFLAFSALSTEFYPAPLDVTALHLERHDFCKYFDAQLADAVPVRAQPFELLMFDGYCLHRSPANPTPAPISRVLLNISFSQQLFDSAANTLHAAFKGLYPKQLATHPCRFLSFKGALCVSPKQRAERMRSQEDPVDVYVSYRWKESKMQSLLLVEWLVSEGFRVRHDALAGVEATKDGMSRGVQASTLFVLFLSESTLCSPNIIYELKEALILPIPILLVHPGFTDEQVSACIARGGEGGDAEGGGQTRPFLALRLTPSSLAQQE